jgi:hypothetical protein
MYLCMVQVKKANGCRIWTHNMKNIQYHQMFTPQSCLSNKTGMAATLGAGVQDGELFAAMAKHDAIAVGGQNNVGETRFSNCCVDWLFIDLHRMLELLVGLPVVATVSQLVCTVWEPITSSRR